MNGWETYIPKRDMFAAMALQGLLANPDVVETSTKVADPAEYFARLAREAADALIAELQRPATAPDSALDARSPLRPPQA